VMDNPFSAVTGKDGTAKIEKIPDGEYTVKSFHSFMGWKEQKVKFEGAEAKVEFKYDGSEEEPAENKGELEDLIKGTDFERLDLLPADFSYREFDLQFAKEKASRLKKLIAPLDKDYDMIVFDCPPSMSGLSEQIFRASDLLLMPLVPTTLSLRTLEQVRSFMESEKIKGVDLKVFFSMVDRRKKMHREVVEAKGGVPEMALETTVPYASAVERMGTERMPVGAFAPKSAPAAAFRGLWDEVSKALG